MKRNLPLSFVLAVVCFFGTLQLKAQEAPQMEPFNPEIRALAEEMSAILPEDPEKANSIFTKLVRKCKKNTAQFYHAGRYFLSQMEGNLQYYSPAKQCADKAYEIDPRDINILMLKGEVAEKAKQWGAAGQAYEEILLIDSTNVTAMNRIADTYKYVNPEVAKEYLFKVKQLAPNDVSADKNLGLIYYREDDFKSSAKHYETYYKATPTDQVDIFSCTQYVNALFLNKSYAKAINVCKTVGPREPENKTFKAVKFWSLVENYELPEAKEAMAFITNKEYPDTAYGYWDYYYAGLLNKEEGNLEQAIAFQKLAVERDSARAAGWETLNNLYQENKQYAEAVPVYKKYLELLKGLNRAQATDTFKLGYLYFTLAQIDSVKSKEWVKEGDAIFAYISESTPDSYLGPIFRARINNVGINEPSDVVKGFYETSSRLIGDNLKYKTDKLECLQYLAYYDIQKDNYPEALAYIEQMEKIDPENGWVKQVKGFVKSQIPQ